MQLPLEALNLKFGSHGFERKTRYTEKRSHERAGFERSSGLIGCDDDAIFGNLGINQLEAGGLGAFSE